MPIGFMMLFPHQYESIHKIFHKNVKDTKTKQSSATKWEKALDIVPKLDLLKPMKRRKKIYNKSSKA